MENIQQLMWEVCVPSVVKMFSFTYINIDVNHCTRRCQRCGWSKRRVQTLAQAWKSENIFFSILTSNICFLNLRDL